MDNPAPPTAIADELVLALEKLWKVHNELRPLFSRLSGKTLRTSSGLIWAAQQVPRDTSRDAELTQQRDDLKSRVCHLAAALTNEARSSNIAISPIFEFVTHGKRADFRIAEERAKLLQTVIHANADQIGTSESADIRKVYDIDIFGGQGVFGFQFSRDHENEIGKLAAELRIAVTEKWPLLITAPNLAIANHVRAWLTNNIGYEASRAGNTPVSLVIQLLRGNIKERQPDAVTANPSPTETLPLTGRLTLAQIWAQHPKLGKKARGRIRSKLAYHVSINSSLGGTVKISAKRSANDYNARLVGDVVQEELKKHNK